MFFNLNQFLRNHLPYLHSRLKQITSGWRNAGIHAIPIPVFSNKRVLLIHPSFMTYGQWEPQVQSWLKTILNKTDVFLDIGAHVGWHTMLASKLVGNKGAVLAFEPSPENLKFLRYHCTLNSLQNVQIYPSAVGDVENSSIPFVLVDGGNHTSNSLTTVDEVPYISEKQKTLISVSLTTIDKVCEKLRLKPRLIKIDVEGAENLVLQGAREVVNKYRPIIIVAIHPFWMPKGQSPNDICNFFSSYSYELKNSQGDLVSELDYGDYIAIPKDKDTV